MAPIRLGKDVMSQANVEVDAVAAFLAAFIQAAKPLESPEHLQVLTDKRTGARYCECHIKASVLVALGTTDVPLDPDEQAEYRANRNVVEDAVAFTRMKDDARHGRSFSNIVAEYTTEFDSNHPIKVIGGQHRFQAIKDALGQGTDELHGLKVYLLLSMDQRLDVQMISNTSIDVSADLIDRMQETMQGPQLRDWCQLTGLLESGQDFADRRERGGPISVQLARTFITNFYLGKRVPQDDFRTSDTSPAMSPSGQRDSDWEELRARESGLWTDPGLQNAATEFAELVASQRNAFATVKGKPKPRPDHPEKAMSPAVLAAWAYVAGILQTNPTRLARHFGLKNAAKTDPLNVVALAQGRHKSDPENYRGLGHRSGPKERGRLVELFFIQAESGAGINPNNIDTAIKRHVAKIAYLDAERAEGATNDGN